MLRVCVPRSVAGAQLHSRRNPGEANACPYGWSVQESTANGSPSSSMRAGSTSLGAPELRRPMRDLPLDAPDGGVHLRQSPRRVVGLLTVDRDRGLRGLAVPVP